MISLFCDDCGRFLVKGKYQLVGDPQQRLQNFAVGSTVMAATPAVQFIYLEIGSNHGNNDYTCLYHIMVHGEPMQQM